MGRKRKEHLVTPGKDVICGDVSLGSTPSLDKIAQMPSVGIDNQSNGNPRLDFKTFPDVQANGPESVHAALCCVGGTVAESLSMQDCKSASPVESKANSLDLTVLPLTNVCSHPDAEENRNMPARDAAETVLDDLKEQPSVSHRRGAFLAACLGVIDRDLKSERGAQTPAWNTPSLDKECEQSHIDDEEGREMLARGDAGTMEDALKEMPCVPHRRGAFSATCSSVPGRQSKSEPGSQTPTWHSPARDKVAATSTDADGFRIQAMQNANTIDMKGVGDHVAGDVACVGDLAGKSLDFVPDEQGELDGEVPSLVDLLRRIDEASLDVVEEEHRPVAKDDATKKEGTFMELTQECMQSHCDDEEESFDIPPPVDAEPMLDDVEEALCVPHRSGACSLACSSATGRQLKSESGSQTPTWHSLARDEVAATSNADGFQIQAMQNANPFDMKADNVTFGAERIDKSLDFVSYGEGELDKVVPSLVELLRRIDEDCCNAQEERYGTRAPDDAMTKQDTEPAQECKQSHIDDEEGHDMLARGDAGTMENALKEMPCVPHRRGAFSATCPSAPRRQSKNKPGSQTPAWHTLARDKLAATSTDADGSRIQAMQNANTIDMKGVGDHVAGDVACAGDLAGKSLDFVPDGQGELDGEVPSLVDLLRRIDEEGLDVVEEEHVPVAQDDATSKEFIEPAQECKQSHDDDEESCNTLARGDAKTMEDALNEVPCAPQRRGAFSPTCSSATGRQLKSEPGSQTPAWDTLTCDKVVATSNTDGITSQAMQNANTPDMKAGNGTFGTESADKFVDVVPDGTGTLEIEVPSLVELLRRIDEESCDMAEDKNALDAVADGDGELEIEVPSLEDLLRRIDEEMCDVVEENYGTRAQNDNRIKESTLVEPVRECKQSSGRRSAVSLGRSGNTKLDLKSADASHIVRRDVPVGIDVSEMDIWEMRHAILFPNMQISAAGVITTRTNSASSSSSKGYHFQEKVTNSRVPVGDQVGRGQLLKPGISKMPRHADTSTHTDTPVKRRWLGHDRNNDRVLHPHDRAFDFRSLEEFGQAYKFDGTASQILLKFCKVAVPSWRKLPDAIPLKKKRFSGGTHSEIFKIEVGDREQSSIVPPACVYGNIVIDESDAMQKANNRLVTIVGDLAVGPKIYTTMGSHRVMEYCVGMELFGGPLQSHFLCRIALPYFGGGSAAADPTIMARIGQPIGALHALPLDWLSEHLEEGDMAARLAKPNLFPAFLFRKVPSPKVQQLACEVTSFFDARKWHIFPDQVSCHTDLHGGNMIREKSGRVRLIDWESACLGHRGMDLSYFMLCAPGATQQSRRAFAQNYLSEQGGLITYVAGSSTLKSLLFDSLDEVDKLLLCVEYSMPLGLTTCAAISVIFFPHLTDQLIRLTHCVMEALDQAAHDADLLDILAFGVVDSVYEDVFGKKR